MEQPPTDDYDTLISALQQVIARFMTVRPDCSLHLVVSVLKDLADAYGGGHESGVDRG